MDKSSSLLDWSVCRISVGCQIEEEYEIALGKFLNLLCHNNVSNRIELSVPLFDNIENEIVICRV